MPFGDNNIYWSLASKIRFASFKQPSRSIYAGHWRSRSLRLPAITSAPAPTTDLTEAEDSAFTDEDDSHLCRVRSFRTTSRGFENRGDSFRKKSRNTLLSSGSSDNERQRLSSTSSDVSGISEVSEISTWTTVSRLSSLARSYFRIAFLGTSGVGKTSIIKQCMTSDFTNSCDTNSLDEEGDEKEDNTMCVLPDGEESMVELLDNLSLGECESMRVDAYIIIFSVTCVMSFKVATSVIQQLRVERSCDRAIILVANKVDLVRQRKVKAEDVRKLANKFDCKCVETSAAINHNVDSLVVGTMTQIRLRLDPPLSTSPTRSYEDVFPKELSTSKNLKALSFLSRLFKHTKRRDNSCENLLH